MLLDEADVFLEARKTGDVSRNAMVSTFLRLLEYYDGVLLLTTNRVTDIDEAFYSRISYPIQYDEFSHETRRQVARNLFQMNKIDMGDEFIDQIAKADCNGRQLKNAIRQARFLAKEHQREVRAADVLMILNRLSAFQKQMSARRLQAPLSMSGVTAPGGDAE